MFFEFFKLSYSINPKYFFKILFCYFFVSNQMLCLKIFLKFCKRRVQNIRKLCRKLFKNTSKVIQKFEQIARDKHSDQWRKLVYLQEFWGKWQEERSTILYGFRKIFWKYNLIMSKTIKIRDLLIRLTLMHNFCYRTIIRQFWKVRQKQNLDVMMLATNSRKFPSFTIL